MMKKYEPRVVMLTRIRSRCSVLRRPDPTRAFAMDRTSAVRPCATN
jgi:hypothetical protein